MLTRHNKPRKEGKEEGRFRMTVDGSHLLKFKLTVVTENKDEIEHIHYLKRVIG